jgi:hypothetical protein
VTCLSTAPSDGYGNPAARASSRARKPSLKTTRAHPNARDSAMRCPGAGSRRKLYRSCTPTALPTSYDNNCDIRTGRHRVFVLHAHLVFVTEYRHRVFTGAHLNRMEAIMRDVCADFETEPAEFNGENNHVHLLVNFPPKVALPKLVNSLKRRVFAPDAPRVPRSGTALLPDQPVVVGFLPRRIGRRGTSDRAPPIHRGAQPPGSEHARA